MSRLRVAIIGCGNIGRAHARAWLKIPERVELAAITDSNQEALNEVGAAWGVAEEHRYLDFRALLDQEHPDIVSICSWHGQHAPMTIAAAARKPKAILCEKPMATSLREADENDHRRPTQRGEAGNRPHAPLPAQLGRGTATDRRRRHWATGTPLEFS